MGNESVEVKIKAMIAEQLGVTHTTIIHHERKLHDLMETDSEIFDTYYALEDHVLKSISGNYKEDGSGEKL